MAVALARGSGFSVDEKISRVNTGATLGAWSKFRGRMLQGIEGLPNMPMTASYTLIGLAADNYRPDRTTDAMVRFLAAKQTREGNWQSSAHRPPMEYSDFTSTALTLRALQLYAPRQWSGEIDRRVDRARVWLRTASPSTMEERVFQLLGLHWSAAPRTAMRKGLAELVALQRPDGGWAQLATLESDAYATGQALVALNQAGCLSASHPAFRRGIQFLLRTQFEDGSWFVQTRSFPVQRYFESGFPHQKSQFISAAATSWATMGLVLGAAPPARSVGSF